MNTIEMNSVNAIRMLSVDMVEKAKSGHPGMPLGCAPIVYELWGEHMKHSCKNPNWINRDRFILSAGHGSAMLYSLLHLFNYGLTVEDLKGFRQENSLTPGHPEQGHTVGVDATTGPLGAGMAMAVGMAMAESHLGSIFNKDGYNIIDHYTYVLGGDGCMMEGITYEALSLAGTLKLDKLIVFYDKNNISIEGRTEQAFDEDVIQRMKAMGFQVIVVVDGNDLNALSCAIRHAKSDKEHPSFIVVNTEIGYGCDAKQGKACAHGEPLGEENIKNLRKNLKWPYTEEFYVSKEIYDHYKELCKNGVKAEEEWQSMFETYLTKYPNMKELWEQYFEDKATENLLEDVNFWQITDDAIATREVSGKLINYLKDKIPGLIGGSADLGPSNKTIMNGEGDFSLENRSGRNLHFGVRELAMTGIVNGLRLHRGLQAYGATFLVFSDYTKPMLRLASIMKLPIAMVFTHDSIGVGEDGPTHEPIEQYAMLRSMPNFNLFRPADATETAAAWYTAVTSKDTPTALALTRQKLPQLAGSSKEALKGGYIIDDSKKDIPDAIVIATGSEVELALKAKEELSRDNIDIRVVSMPCMSLFAKQSEEYQNSVLPKSVKKRVVIEAASEFGWHKYAGDEGIILSMNNFGESAPAKRLFEKYGFTVENIVSKVKNVL